jgi:hypothetical protein
MRCIKLGAALRVCAGVALSGVAVAPAMAQVPPNPDVANIASCLCLQRAIDAAGAARSDRERAYESSRREVADLDAQLQSARMSLNVDDPSAVAQFRQLLERRDAVLRQSSGPLFNQFYSAVALYNQRVDEFNARCAGRPTNPVLLAQVQATLVCPGP